MIIYTDKLLADWQAGRQVWFIALVRPKYRGVQAVVEHERTHIKQWALTTFLTAWACAFAAFVLNKHLGFTCLDLLPLLAVPPSAHGLLYLTMRKYRLWAEVQAYRVSLAYRPDQIDHYANVLASKYKLGLAVHEARELLK